MKPILRSFLKKWFPVLLVTNGLLVLFYFNEAMLSSFTVIKDDMLLPEDHARNGSLHKITIFNVDTRPLTSSLNSSFYWNIAAVSNYLYSRQHGYAYYYLRSNISCASRFKCRSFYNHSFVDSPWLKVKGILLALDELMEDGDIGVYLDSDAVINHHYFNISLLEWYINHSSNIFEHLYTGQSFDWQNEKRCEKNNILLLNDDQTYWFRETVKHHPTYKLAINSGVIIFRKCAIVRHIMNIWWQSSNVATPYRKLHPEQHLSNYWPWEQDQLNYMVDTGFFSNYIVFQKWSLEVARSHLFMHLAGGTTGGRTGFDKNLKFICNYTTDSQLHRLVPTINF